MKGLVAAAVSFATIAGIAGAAQAAGDADKGEKVFNRCRACHAVGDNARNKIGPVLNGVVGNKSGQVEKYRYSRLAKAAAEAGLTWTEDNLMAYLEDPTKFLKAYVESNGGKARGRSKMAYKLGNEGQRADVIAYLATFE